MASSTKREEKKGEWKDVKGPDPSEYPVVTVVQAIDVSLAVNNGEFKKGLWSLATQRPAHPKRLGRAIVPQTLIVHTTDMKPGTFDAIVKRWTSEPGKGNAAHFLIGKTEKDGVVQFAPIHQNANHAGGANCGGIKLPNGVIVHPNVCSVGVEIDNAGKLKKDKAGWYHKDTGYRFAPEDVFVDEKGRGWEKITPYQITMLSYLWNALRPTLKPYPEGTTVMPNATYESQGSIYGKPTKPSLIGHVSTNPINKTDPGPQVMKEINSWA